MGCDCAQALKKHAEEMIQDSDRFEEPIEKLFERFDKNQPFSYSISADVWPNLTWKGPYDGLKVLPQACRVAGTHGCCAYMLHLAPQPESASCIRSFAMQVATSSAKASSGVPAPVAPALGICFWGHMAAVLMDLHASFCMSCITTWTLPWC